MKFKNKMRKGFSLIEIIIMITVISFILPTVASLIKISVDSLKEFKYTTYYANGYGKTYLTIRKLWDNANVKDFDLNGKYYVLRSNSVASNNNDLNCIGNFRNGHYKAKNRRKCDVDLTDGNVTAIGLDGTESFNNNNLNDIDDFNNLEIRVIPENKITDGLINEVKTASNVGIGNYKIILGSVALQDEKIIYLGWINKILSENYDEINPSTSIDNITLKVFGSSTSIYRDLIDKLVRILPTLKIKTQIEFINYTKSGASNNTFDLRANTTVNATGDTTDIKRILITLTDLQNKDTNTRRKIRYYYYATNIGTDIPILKVNN